MDVDIKVGRVECNIAVGAIENGNVQLVKFLRVVSIDLGGWVEGVSMSFVRAISRGARMIPAMPAAETATVKEASGECEDSTSRPPAYEKFGAAVNDSPGSGRARKAEKKDRTKDVRVDKKME